MAFRRSGVAGPRRGCKIGAAGRREKGAFIEKTCKYRLLTLKAADWLRGPPGKGEGVGRRGDVETPPDNGGSAFAAELRPGRGKRA